MMDIETVYLFVGVFVLSAVMLVVLQKLFKNKSYEEVIAEQRQQTNALYSNQQKPKVKDKKQKKALKKSKEKKPEVATDDVADETSDQTEAAEEETEVEVHKPHMHVEFKEPTFIEEPIKENKPKQRRESVKPILVNRDSSSELQIHDILEVPMANHFEESHPKDEFELLNAHNAHVQLQSKEEAITVSNAPSKNEKKKKAQIADKKSKHQVNEIISKHEKPAAVEKPKEKVEIVEVVEEILTAVTQNGIAAVPIHVPTQTPAPVKDKKKKKSELNILTQTTDKAGVNVSHLTALVAKTDMSKQDVQMLIDVLLNKQHDAPSIINEWSEGKGDPVEKLKKQLAEKSEQLTDLQGTLTGTQNKLRELRAEHLGERSQYVQTVRDLQERQAALNLEKLTNEQKMQNMNVKYQQMQEAMNEEAAKARKMVDEYSKLTMQCKQMDASMGGLRDVEMKNEQLRTDIATYMNQHNASLMQLGQAKEEFDKKEQQIAALQHVRSTLENQAQQLTYEKQQLSNELQLMHDKMRAVDLSKEHEMKLLQKQADDASKEVLKTKNDLRLVMNENVGMQEKLGLTVEEITKLKDDCVRLDCLNKQSATEKHKLQEEMGKLQEAKTNGSIETDKQHQIVINQLSNELKNVRNQLEQNDANNRSTVETLKKQYDGELDELRNKNNDLRKKNWKVMDALNAAESRAKSSIANANEIVSKNKDNEILAMQVRNEERDSRTKFFKRLFPSIEVSTGLNDNQWEDAVEVAVRDFIKKSSTPAPAPLAVITEDVDDAEVQRLRSKVANYEKIIGETEGILCKLQTHVEDEQIRWRRELKSKEDSIVLLNELLETKQQELRKKTECLTETITNNSHTTNGPTACILTTVPQLSSTESSAASSVADLSEKKNKKKKKKKNKENN